MSGFIAHLRMVASKQKAKWRVEELEREADEVDDLAAPLGKLGPRDVQFWAEKD